MATLCVDFVSQIEMEYSVILLGFHAAIRYGINNRVDSRFNPERFVVIWGRHQSFQSHRASASFCICRNFQWRLSHIATSILRCEFASHCCRIQFNLYMASWNPLRLPSHYAKSSMRWNLLPHYNLDCHFTRARECLKIFAVAFFSWLTFAVHFRAEYTFSTPWK